MYWIDKENKAMYTPQSHLVMVTTQVGILRIERILADEGNNSISMFSKSFVKMKLPLPHWGRI